MEPDKYTVSIKKDGRHFCWCPHVHRSRRTAMECGQTRVNKLLKGEVMNKDTL